MGRDAHGHALSFPGQVVIVQNQLMVSFNQMYFHSEMLFLLSRREMKGKVQSITRN
jgi:hypothetical protein